MDGAREFIAIYPFRNESDHQFDLILNDILEVTNFHSVQQSNTDFPGWIWGKNKRSGIEGYFPGTCVLR